MSKKGIFVKNKGQKSRFNLYDWIYRRDHKPDADDDRDAPRNFSFFFKLLSRNFSRIFSLNLYFVFGNVALWLLLFLLSGVLGPHTTAPTSDLYAPLAGALPFTEGSLLLNVLLSVHGAMTEVSVMTPFIIALIVVGILFLALTFGPVMTGISINMRNIVRGEPLFLWADFKHAIKSNLRQAIFLGIFDLGIIFLLCYGLLFYYMNLGKSLLFNTCFLFTIVLLVMYGFMRKYLYLMLVTFELSIPKLFKNALIFSLLGLGRNLLSTLGCLLVVFLNWMLFTVFLPLGVILPLMITIGLCLFIDAYAAWPKIQSVMIDPYVGMDDEEDA